MLSSWVLPRRITMKPEINLEPSILVDHFSIIEDPRSDRSKKYPLVNVLIFSFVSVLAGQNSWYQMQAFCEETLDWFSEFLDTSSGVPSHDTFRRIFSLLNPLEFESCVIQWIESTRKKYHNRQRVIALDGKSVRGLSWKINDKQLHILNAWDCSEERFIGQLSIENKTNEITAAPNLLKQLNLKETIVTVDAMMTQTQIAEQIINQKGDYLMALKGNQGTLFEDVKLYFTEVEFGMSSARTVEKNRGQVEIRKGVKARVDWLDQKSSWKGLKSIFKLETEVYQGGKTRIEERYYLSSLDVEPNYFLSLVRGHWKIENQLHRTLDIHFQEDANQEHNRNAAANLSLLRKLAISLLKGIDPKEKMIIKMKKIAYSPKFRRECLFGKF
jgi:predicted transposase YbfD/YdcC